MGENANAMGWPDGATLKYGQYLALGPCSARKGTWTVVHAYHFPKDHEWSKTVENCAPKQFK